MKYNYRNTGIMVESSSPLDSALFSKEKPKEKPVPVPEKEPEKPKRATRKR